MRYFWGESESVYGESESFLFSFLHYLCGMPAPVPSCVLLRSNEWDISRGKVKVYMVKVKVFYLVFCIICVVWLLHAAVTSCVLLRNNEWYISRGNVKVYIWWKWMFCFVLFCFLCGMHAPAVSSLEVMNKRFSTREFFFRGTTTVFSILVMHCLS